MNTTVSERRMIAGSEGQCGQQPRTRSRQPSWTTRTREAELARRRPEHLHAFAVRTRPAHHALHHDREPMRHHDRDVAERPCPEPRWIQERRDHSQQQPARGVFADEAQPAAIGRRGRVKGARCTAAITADSRLLRVGIAINLAHGREGAAGIPRRPLTPRIRPRPGGDGHPVLPRRRLPPAGRSRWQ